MSRVICPFCFKVHDFDVRLECSDRRQEVPARYVLDYATVAPLWLMTIGFPRHGKTTYLAALTLLLEELSALVDGMWYRPLDGHSFAAVRQMRDEADLGKAVRKTPAGPVRPNLFHVHGIPGFESRCLVLYDIPGESYDSFDDVGDYAPAMKQVNTAWFLVSLRDLTQSGEGRTITDLFNVYLSGMEKLRVEIEGWNLIVVFTKADQETFTPQIKSYLQSDPLSELASGEGGALPGEREEVDFAAYLEEMRRVSDLLEDYTRRHVRGGAGFVNMVRASRMNLVFSVTSALGQSPDRLRGGLRQATSPYRVLDPFLWALTLERPRAPRTLRLVVEPSAVLAGAGREAILDRTWNRLSDHGEVTTHYLGRALPAAGPGRLPPGPDLETDRPRLLGPILEQASAEDRVLVITSGAIDDFEDFRRSAWKERLLLVVLGGDSPHRWPHLMAHAAGEVASESWVERLLTM